MSNPPSKDPVPLRAPRSAAQPKRVAGEGAVKRIVLVTDPSGQRKPSLDRAAQMAAAVGASVRVCLFDHSSAIDAMSHIASSGGAKARAQFVAVRSSWVQVDAERLRARGLRATAATRWTNHPDTEIVRYAQGLGAGLIVKDASLSGGIRHAIHRALDDTLLAECTVPLLLVTTEGGAPRRLLAAVDVAPDDPSCQRLNDTVVRTAQYWARALQAHVELAYAHHPLPFSISNRSQLEARLRELARRFAIAEADTHFIEGEPGDALHALAAERGTDLLVIGTGRSLGIARILVGRTAAHLLDAVGCDLLAVPLASRCGDDAVRPPAPPGGVAG